MDYGILGILCLMEKGDKSDIVNDISFGHCIRDCTAFGKWKPLI